MNEPLITKPNLGLAGFKLTREEAESPWWRRFHQAIEEELHLQRLQNDDPGLNIQATTVMRGQIGLLKRISARTTEVGLKSRPSEGDALESANFAPAAGRLQLS